jgi:hypothetical protein
VDQLTSGIDVVPPAVRTTVRQQGISPQPPLGIGWKSNGVEATSETTHGQFLTP